MPTYTERRNNAVPLITRKEIMGVTGISIHMQQRLEGNPNYRPKEGVRDMYETALEQLEMLHRDQNNAAITAKIKKLNAERT